MNSTKKKTLERRIERKNKSLSACRLEIALALSSPTAQHTYATWSALGTHKNKITLHFSLLKNMQTITGHNVTYATSVLSFSQEKQVGDRHHRLSKAEKVHSSLPFFFTSFHTMLLRSIFSGETKLRLPNSATCTQYTTTTT